MCKNNLLFTNHFMKNILKNVQAIIVVQIMKQWRFKCIFSQITSYFGLFYRSVDLHKIFLNDIFFIWTKYEKNNNGQNWVLL
jgi:hypothetical protein